MVHLVLKELRGETQILGTLEALGKDLVRGGISESMKKACAKVLLSSTSSLRVCGWLSKLWSLF